MFTGIIEEVGMVRRVRKGAKSSVLTIAAEVVFDDLKVGDSVATNGVCLTVTETRGKEYSADVMNETLARSTLGKLVTGSKVNLERAMPANGRFGGHIVSGHVDGTGKITRIQKDDNATWYTITAEDKLMRYIVEKGSITVDGISLTVAKVEKNQFMISIIPHTAKETTLRDKKIGSFVNLENDMIGKYIEKFMSKGSSLDREFLAEHGY